MIKYKVGDKVVYEGESGLDGLFEIETLTKTGKPKTVKTERFGNLPCRYCTVRHATDAEIQCGHRIPSVEVLRDCDIPPNTIVLER